MQMQKEPQIVKKKNFIKFFIYLIVKSINGPLKFDKIKIDYEKSDNPIGISQMSWSFDSNFLATKNGKKIFKK